jgi:hypothetical protein
MWPIPIRVGIGHRVIVAGHNRRIRDARDCGREVQSVMNPFDIEDDWAEIDQQAQAVRVHAHCWIDPTEAPIQRAPYSPVVGVRRREMKPGHVYQCRECPATCSIPAESEPF